MTLPEITRCINCHAILLFLLILVIGQPAKAQKEEKSKKKTKPYEVNLGLSAFYDDNILKYSEKYLERFMNNQDPGRFHIETYDDFIIKPSLNVAATYKIFKEKRSKFNISYNYNGYMVNEVKIWQFFSVGYLQYFAKRASFKITYSYVPDFYVRHFRDEDWVKIYGYKPITFVPFSFSKDNYSLWVQNTFFKDLRVRLSFDYALYYHNEHYTEYDCKNYYYGFQVIKGIGKKVSLEFDYEYMTSDAKGYDQPEETKETSDDADADHLGDAFQLGVNWELPRIFKKRNFINGNAEYLKRFYTTDNYVQEDPEHAGRVDDVLNLALNYQVRVSNSFEVSLFYKWFGRNSWTTSELNSTYVSNEKDYKQNQVGLDLVYKIKF